MNNEPKPWWKRTEFWVTAASMIAASIVPVAAAGPLTLGTAAPAIGGVIMKLLGITGPAVAYTISRGVAKAGTGN